MNTTIPASVYSEASPTFSPARCLAYARLYLNANRKLLLLTLSQIFMVSFIFFIFNFYVSGTSIYSYGDMSVTNDFLWRSETSIMVFLFMVIMMISGSMMYGAVSAKRDRLYSLQIPASQFEKFLTWLIIYLPLTLVSCWVCFYAADVLRVIWIKLFTPFGDFARVIPLKHVLSFETGAINNPESTFSVVTIFSFGLLLNSIFALGGIFFHRLSFLKTLICGFILFMICMLMFYLGITVFFDGHMESANEISTRQYSLSVLFASVMTAISAFCYWLSYKRLKEEEIITRW
ncbi:MAG: hypothetical protein K2M56_10255 [Muribaculaceae bacterium]|nr:hypothetical protein [Muribaculaceae bacterium]